MTAYWWVLHPESIRVDCCTRLSLQFGQDITQPDVDFFRTASGVCLGSDAMCTVLKQCQPDIQLLPASGRYADGRAVEKPCQLILPGKKVDEFDCTLSEYAGKSLILVERAFGKCTHPAKGITTLVIDSNRAAGQHFFFLAHVLYFQPIVSPELAQALA